MFLGFWPDRMGRHRKIELLCGAASLRMRPQQEEKTSERDFIFGTEG